MATFAKKIQGNYKAIEDNDYNYSLKKKRSNNDFDSNDKFKIIGSALSGTTGGALIGGSVAPIIGGIVGGIIGAAVTGFSAYKQIKKIKRKI